MSISDIDRPGLGTGDDGYDEDGYDESQRAEILEVTAGGTGDGTILTDLAPDLALDESDDDPEDDDDDEDVDDADDGDDGDDDDEDEEDTGYRTAGEDEIGDDDDDRP